MSLQVALEATSRESYIYGSIIQKIGLSLVKLESVKDNIIEIRGVDILNETPLIDIKPYIPNFDFVEGEIKSGWMNSSLDEVKNKKSDKRFL